VQLSDSTIIEFDRHRNRVIFRRSLMFRITRRTDRLADVRFCDSCAQVTTAAERARRHRERTVSYAQAQIWLH
jgi:hypothetical protein